MALVYKRVVPPAASISVNKDVIDGTGIVDTKIVTLNVTDIVVKVSKNQYIGENEEET